MTCIDTGDSVDELTLHNSCDLSSSYGDDIVHFPSFKKTLDVPTVVTTRAPPPPPPQSHVVMKNRYQLAYPCTADLFDDTVPPLHDNPTMAWALANELSKHSAERLLFMIEENALQAVVRLFDVDDSICHTETLSFTPIGIVDGAQALGTDGGAQKYGVQAATQVAKQHFVRLHALLDIDDTVRYASSCAAIDARHALPVIADCDATRVEDCVLHVNDHVALQLGHRTQRATNFFMSMRDTFQYNAESQRPFARRLAITVHIEVSYVWQAIFDGHIRAILFSQSFSAHPLPPSLLELVKLFNGLEGVEAAFLHYIYALQMLGHPQYHALIDRHPHKTIVSERVANHIEQLARRIRHYLATDTPIGSVAPSITNTPRLKRMESVYEQRSQNKRRKQQQQTDDSTEIVEQESVV